MTKSNKFVLIVLILISFSCLTYQFNIASGAQGIKIVDSNVYVIYPEKVVAYSFTGEKTVDRSVEHTLNKLGEGIIKNYDNSTFYSYNFRAHTFENIIFPIKNVDTFVIKEDNIAWCSSDTLYRGKLTYIKDDNNDNNDMIVSQVFQTKLTGTCANVLISDNSVYVVKTNGKIQGYYNNIETPKYQFEPLVIGKCVIYNNMPVCEGTVQGGISFINPSDGSVMLTTFIDSPVKEFWTTEGSLLVLSEKETLYMYTESQGAIKKIWETAAGGYMYKFTGQRFVYSNRNTYTIGTIDYYGNIKSLQSAEMLPITSRAIPIDIDSVADPLTGKTIVATLLKTEEFGVSQYFLQIWEEGNTCAIETLAASKTNEIIKGKVYPERDVVIEVNNKRYNTGKNQNTWWTTVDFTGMKGDSAIVKCIVGNNPVTTTYIALEDVKRKLYVSYPEQLGDTVVFEILNEYNMPVNNVEVEVNNVDKYYGHETVKVRLSQGKNIIEFMAPGYEEKVIILSRAESSGILYLIAAALLIVMIVIIKIKTKKKKIKNN